MPIRSGSLWPKWVSEVKNSLSGFMVLSVLAFRGGRHACLYGFDELAEYDGCCVLANGRRHDADHQADVREPRRHQHLGFGELEEVGIRFREMVEAIPGVSDVQLRRKGADLANSIESGGAQRRALPVGTQV